MMPLLGAIAILVAGLGLLTLYLGVKGVGREAGRATRSKGSPARAWLQNLDKQQRRNIIIGVAGGLVLYVVSGWLILLIAVPAAAIFLPVLLSGQGAKRAIERLEGLEIWTRTLAGSVAGDANLEQAIVHSTRSTPEALREPVQLLVARIQSRISTEDALQAFADDINDASADVVVAHLKLASRQRGAGLSRALDDAAESIHDEIKARRQIETDRAKPRQSTRIVALITISFVLLAALSSSITGGFFDSYRTPVGQLIIAVFLGVFAALLGWQYQLAKPRPLPRFLIRKGDGTA